MLNLSATIGPMLTSLSKITNGLSTFSEALLTAGKSARASSDAFQKSQAAMANAVGKATDALKQADDAAAVADQLHKTAAATAEAARQAAISKHGRIDPFTAEGSAASKATGEERKAAQEKADADKRAKVASLELAEVVKRSKESLAQLPATPIVAFAVGIKDTLAGIAKFTRSVVDLAGIFIGFQSLTSSLASLFGKTASVLGVVVGGLGGMVAALGKAIGSGIGKGAGALFRATGIPRLGRAIGNSRVGQFFGRLGKAGFGHLGKMGGAAGQALSGVGKAAAGAGRAATKVVAGTAKAGIAAASGIASVIDGTIGAFNQLTGTVTGFVAAFAPATIEAFSYALRDVTAVIGMALEPILIAATAVVKDFSATLLPLMRDLRPIIMQLSATMMELSKVFINNFAVVLKAVLPIVQMLADLLSALSPMIAAATAIISGLVQVVSYLAKSFLEWLGIDISDTMKSLRSAMEELARYTLMAVAAFLRLINVGMSDSFIKGVRDAMSLDKFKKKDEEAPVGMFGRMAAKAKEDEPKGLFARLGDGIRGIGKRAADAAALAAPIVKDGVAKEDATGFQAYTNSSYSNFGDYGKQIALGASIASGGGDKGPKTSEEWLKKISDSLDSVQAMGRGDVWKSLTDAITNGVKAAIATGTENAWEGTKLLGMKLIGLGTPSGGS